MTALGDPSNVAAGATSGGYFKAPTNHQSMSVTAGFSDNVLMEMPCL